MLTVTSFRKVICKAAYKTQKGCITTWAVSTKSTWPSPYWVSSKPSSNSFPRKAGCFSVEALIDIGSTLGRFIPRFAGRNQRTCVGLRRLLVSSSIGPIASLILLEILTPIHLTVNTLLIFNVALAETDIKKIMNDGFAWPLRC